MTLYCKLCGFDMDQSYFPHKWEKKKICNSCRRKTLMVIGGKK